MTDEEKYTEIEKLALSHLEKQLKKLSDLEKENAELKAQIEKMAVCLNCKNGSNCNLQAEVHKLDFDPFGKCDKWEFGE